MKKLGMALILITGIIGAVRAENHSGDLGAGIVLGDINGPTVKYFVGPNTALDLGIGFSSEMEAYGDIIWHGWDVFPKPEQGHFGGYLGFGPRYQARDHGDDKFGIRGLAGADYWMAPYPIEFFLEMGPWFVFSPDTDTEVDFGIGLRYYFRASGSSAASHSHRR
jgi:hypothetical protein